MAFSLTYAFGRMGRHVRKIAREARSFAGTKFRNLAPGPLREFLFAQFVATDSTLFGIFYNDDPSDPRYSMHQKYASELLDVTACEFLGLCHAYSCSILVAQPLEDSAQLSPQECETILGILDVIDCIYGGSAPTQLWTTIAIEPNPLIIAAALCEEIAQVLQLDPQDKAAFSNEWLSLLPHIIAGTNTLLANEDWSNTSASMIESSDYGGHQI